MAEYRIGKRTDTVAGHEVFELWQRLGGGAEDVLVGEFETREAAEVAMNEAMADPDRELHEPLGTTDEMVDDDRDDYAP